MVFAPLCYAFNNGDYSSHSAVFALITGKQSRVFAAGVQREKL